MLVDQEQNVNSDHEYRDGQYATLDVDCLRPSPYQARIKFDPVELDGLAQSIRRNNLIQPVIVRPLGKGVFEIVAGERRWRATAMAGLTEIPVIVRYLSDAQAQEIALLENIQRENLTPIEEAKAIKRLMDNFGLIHEEVGVILSKQRSTITHTLRLLDLPEPVQELIHLGKLTAGHGKALAGVGNASRLVVLANRAVREHMNVRTLEKAVAKYEKMDKRASDPGIDRRDPDVKALENRLSNLTGASVEVKTGKNLGGAGQLVINYDNPDHLQFILQGFKSLEKRAKNKK